MGAAPLDDHEAASSSPARAASWEREANPRPYPASRIVSRLALNQLSASASASRSTAS